MLSQFRDQRIMSGLDFFFYDFFLRGSVLWLCTPVSPSVPEMEGIIIICHWGTRISFEDAPLVEFMYLVFTGMPSELPWATRVFIVVLVRRISRFRITLLSHQRN